jgi:hypothetical protein
MKRSLDEIIARIKSEDRELMDRFAAQSTVAYLESLTCKDGCHPCDKCQSIFEAIEIIGRSK